MYGIDILIIADDPSSMQELKHKLQDEGYGVTCCLNKEKGLTAIEENEFDVVIIDLEHESIDEFTLLRRSKELYPATEVIIITASASVEIAVEAIKEGAFHYLPKPFHPDEVLFLVKNAMDKRIMRLELMELRDLVSGKRYLNDLIGKSPKIQQLKKEITRVAPLDCTVLIRGETGTGKEMVARIIHRMSLRAERKFLAVNCGTLNGELLSNELFGHEKEAFTGAQKVKKGVFEAISGGTILLDEIGDMPAQMQVQLLRVLQEKTVMRVGGTEEIPVDVRILAATNRPLKEEIKKGTFRQDLYYRLNVFTLRIPPLRERLDDLPLFCRYFVDKYSRQFGKDVNQISAAAMQRIVSYPFPGNVRELENIIERAVVLADGQIIMPEHLPQRLLGREAKLHKRQKKEHLLTLAELEQEHILKALEHTGYNKTQAAKILGIDRVSLWRKMKRYGLETNPSVAQ
jgi:DNA-binding NtrC family response regulator